MKQNWLNTPPTKNSIKKSKIASIVALSIFAVTLILSVVIGIIFPRPEKVKEIDETRFTSVFYADADEWFYSTEKNVVRLNHDNDVLEKFSLAEEAKARNVEIGQIKATYAVPNSEYMWVVASNATNENSGYVFKMTDSNGELSIEEVASFDGLYRVMLVAGEELFIFTQPDAFTTIYKYNVNNISAGPVSRGALYKGWEDGNVMKMEKSDLSILSVDVIDGYLYVLHTGGLLKMSTDFSQNNYKFAYWEKQKEVYAQLYAEATQGLPAGETLDSDTVKALKKQANKDTCTALGLKAYNENSDMVEIPLKSFDVEKYGYYIGDKFCGGAYVPADGKYYIISLDTNLYSYDIAYLAGLPMNTYLECDLVNGIQLYSIPKAQQSSMFYNRYSNKAYIVYDSIPEISCINFNNGPTLEFTLKAEFDISNIVQINDNLYYFYYNRFETKVAGRSILATINIDKQLGISLYTTILIIGMVVCLLSGLCALVFVRAWKQEGYLQKMKSLLKQLVKNKWVYVSMIPSIILLVLFCYYPAVDSIRLSFFEYTTEKPTMRWNNFENYKKMFNNSYTGEMFGNMFLFLVVDLLVAIAPPLVFAFFLIVMRNKGYSQLMRTLLFIPGVIPGIAGLLIWREGIFSNSGGVLHMLCSLFTDDPHMFLTSPITTRFELLLIGFPYVGSYLIFYGGMMNIADSYYEAAELEGIGIWKRFFAIDIPLIMPQIKYIFIMTFISSVQNFGRVDSVTGGLQGTMTPIQMIYDKINESGAYGEASAYATLIFVFLFFATALNLRGKKKEVEI